jgi:hypothetical protein
MKAVCTLTIEFENAKKAKKDFKIFKRLERLGRKYTPINSEKSIENHYALYSFFNISRCADANSHWKHNRSHK